MLNQLRLGRVTLALAGIMVVCLTAPMADAFVTELENAQSAHGGLLHQWKFEGDDDSTKLLDSEGSLDLEKVAGPGGMGENDPTPDMPGSGDETPWSYSAGDVNNIGFEAGFEGAGNSQAYRPEKNAAATSTFGEERVAQSRSGAGLVAQTFSTPARVTFEAIVRPDAWEDTANTLAYIAQTRPGSDRGYFLAQQADANPFGGDGTLSGIVGQSFGDRPPIVDEYSAGDWYYIAATYDGLDAGPTAIGNAYYKNLTADGPLVHAVVDHAFSVDGSLVGATGPLGIGLFAIGQPADSAQEFFNGALENLAVYRTVLSANQIAQHAVGVPEPASLLLVGLSGSALMLLIRRRS